MLLKKPINIEVELGFGSHLVGLAHQVKEQAYKLTKPLYRNPYLDRSKRGKNQKGLEFEKICKWYLLNSPFYKKQIKNVWLWSEWKDRWSNQDRGIDLIAETKSGEIWAIQAKAYDSKNQIPKSDIDSFLSEKAYKLNKS